MTVVRLLAVLAAASVLFPARARSDMLPENIMALQEALIWTGDYEGAVDGKAGKDMAAALKQFQTREGIRVTGRAASADARLLAERSAAARSESGWGLFIDGANDLVAFVPRGLLPVERRDGRERVLASPDGVVQLRFFGTAEPLKTLHAARRDLGDRTVETDTLSATRSVLSGQSENGAFFEFATGTRTAKGFRLTFPRSARTTWQRIGHAIAASFVAEPGEPASKKSARKTPSFVGLFRFDDRRRPYAHAQIDVEVREQTIASGDVAVNLSAEQPPPPAGAKPQKRKRRPDFDAPFVPRLRIFVSGEPVFETVESERVTHFSEVSLAELDPSNRHPEVVLTSYSGGAQCCTDLTVFSSDRDGTWFRIDAGSFDGAPDFVRDTDGDGRFELVNADSGFTGAFDCPSCSYAPDRIRRLAGRTITDVSGDPRYLKHHRARLGEIWLWGWQDNAVAKEGFLAGLTAAARRTGQGDDALALAEKHGPRKARPGEPPFPERLRSFLEQLGY